ncbi:Protein of unknown function [Pyronema omphalodes CBS 100304]|uniref:Uncharacterized protein n=1 Tax=Pyronema omphalodes (strain CBS 100304) TaxID=1076935 RepID=U4L5Q9_PYROM|nr:Protein of unknown function [Pyronema omphalodes CBS 100304]
MRYAQIADNISRLQELLKPATEALTANNIPKLLELLKSPIEAIGAHIRLLRNAISDNASRLLALVRSSIQAIDPEVVAVLRMIGALNKEATKLDQEAERLKQLYDTRRDADTSHLSDDGKAAHSLREIYSKRAEYLRKKSSELLGNLPEAKAQSQNEVNKELPRLRKNVVSALRRCRQTLGWSV